MNWRHEKKNEKQWKCIWFCKIKLVKTSISNIWCHCSQWALVKCRSICRTKQFIGFHFLEDEKIFCFFPPKLTCFHVSSGVLGSIMMFKLTEEFLFRQGTIFVCVVFLHSFSNHKYRHTFVILQRMNTFRQEPNSFFPSFFSTQKPIPSVTEQMDCRLVHSRKLIKGNL